MTVKISNTETTNSFEYWRNRTNETAYALRSKAVTVNSNTAIGNASVSGTLSASVLHANSTTTSNSTTTGALTVAGGAGIVENMYVGGLFDLSGIGNFQSNVVFNDETTHAANAWFADNAVVSFGNADDLQIYHDGDDSYIVDSGLGTLFVLSNSLITIGNVDGSETIATFNPDAEVALYYDNSLKLETTATGVDVDGNANVVMLTVGGTSDFGANVGIPAPGNIQLADQSGNGLKYLRVAASEDGLEYANAAIANISEIDNVNINEAELANAHVIVWSTQANTWTNVPRSLIDVTSISDIDNVNGATTGSVLVKVEGSSEFSGTSNGFVSGTLNLYDRTTYTGQTSNTITHASATGSTVEAFVNGIKLDPVTDYTSNTTAVVFNSDFIAADVIDIVTFDPNNITVGDGTVTDSDHLSYSDERLKKDIRLFKYKDAWKMLQLEAVSYDWEDEQYGTEREVGFLAQDIEEVLPSFVSEDAGGFKKVDYGKMVAPLLELVKNLNARVVHLENRLRDE